MYTFVWKNIPFLYHINAVLIRIYWKCFDVWLYGVLLYVLCISDRNDDRLITEEEFAMLPPGEIDGPNMAGDQEWLIERKKEFKDVIDLNGDGFVDEAELKVTVHSFIQVISIVPLQVHYYSVLLPAQHRYCVGVSCRSATGNCEWRTCNPWPFGWKVPNLPMSLHAPQHPISVFQYR